MTIEPMMVHLERITADSSLYRTFPKVTSTPPPKLFPFKSIAYAVIHLRVPLPSRRTIDLGSRNPIRHGVDMKEKREKIKKFDCAAVQLETELLEIKTTYTPE
jgi:hypothetical protein